MTVPFFAPSDPNRVFDFWISQGMSTRIAWQLKNENIGTIEELRAYGRERFLKIPNIGKLSEKIVAERIGWGMIKVIDKTPMGRIADALERIALAIERAKP